MEKHSYKLIKSFVFVFLLDKHKFVHKSSLHGLVLNLLNLDYLFLAWNFTRFETVLDKLSFKLMSNLLDSCLRIVIVNQIFQEV